MYFHKLINFANLFYILKQSQTLEIWERQAPYTFF